MGVLRSGSEKMWRCFLVHVFSILKLISHKKLFKIEVLASKSSDLSSNPEIHIAEAQH